MRFIVKLNYIYIKYIKSNIKSQGEDTALRKFDPEDDEAGIGIAFSHIGDEFDLIRGMPVRMMLRSSESVPEGFN